MTLFKIIVIFLITSLMLQACVSTLTQSNLTKKETRYSATATQLFKYLDDCSKFDTLEKNVILKNYIYLGKVYDTSRTTIRFHKKFVDFYGWFRSLKEDVDSIGFKNIEVIALRMYKKQDLFDHFEENIKARTMLYYHKDLSDKPLGALLFDSTSNKISTWLIIDSLPKYYYLYYRDVDPN